VRVKLLNVTLIAAACIAGILSAQLICRSISCRNALGVLLGRGKLLALVQGAGIYEADVLRLTRELRSRTAANDSAKIGPEIDAPSVLSRLVANVRAENLARHEPISHAAIDRESGVLRYQIRPEAGWLAALYQNDFSPGSLRRQVARELQARRWIEREIANRVHVTTDDCLRYYQTHPELFSQPMRFRARHLFLAAPSDTPPEVVEAKQRAIEEFSERVAQGEKFEDLIGVASEDEATKTRGGDLDYFSESRMPSDFFAAIKGIRVGQISSVIRTRLGFHLVQLTNAVPTREMPFDQVEAEIRLTLENQKRQVALEQLKGDLSRPEESIATPTL
jgi:hypothetical protein